MNFKSPAPKSLDFWAGGSKTGISLVNSGISHKREKDTARIIRARLFEQGGEL